MDTYSSYDYLCNEPFYIDGIGNVKCPTLRDIRKITYNLFLVYINTISLNLNEYLKSYGLLEKYNELSPSEQEKNSLFNLLLYGNTELLFGLLTFFIVDEVRFNESELRFDVYRDIDNSKQIIGYLDSDNYDNFTKELQSILGIIKPEEKKPVFKNSLAQKMFNKLQQYTQEQKKKTDTNYTFDNMIMKYCTHNKVGINILNVWDMTYYQFVSMFSEYGKARECDFNDMMAANTFSYKKSSDYKPMEYMKKLSN